jgi:hypothetical protein
VITGRATTKAVIELLPHVGRKAPTPSRRRSVDRASAAHFVSVDFLGHKPQQVQNLTHRDAGAHLLKIDARHCPLGPAEGVITNQNQRQQRRGARNRTVNATGARHRAAVELPAATPSVLATDIGYRVTSCPWATPGELPVGNSADIFQLHAIETPHVTLLRDRLQDRLPAFCDFFPKTSATIRDPSAAPVARATPRKWPHSRVLLTCRQVSVLRSDRPLHASQFAQPAPVGHTSVSNAPPQICSGHLDRGVSDPRAWKAKIEISWGVVTAVLRTRLLRRHMTAQPIESCARAAVR